MIFHCTLYIKMTVYYLNGNKKRVLQHFEEDFYNEKVWH